MLRHACYLLVAAISAMPAGGNVDYTCPSASSCVTAISCAATHSRDFLNDMLLFQCGPGYLCCPPRERYGATTPKTPAKASSGNSLERLESAVPPVSDYGRSTTRAPLGTKSSASLIRPEVNNPPKPINGLSTRNTTAPATPRPSPSNAETTSTTVRALAANGFSMPWEHRNSKLLPQLCGAVPATNKIVEGDDAAVGEYPWMALVGFTGLSGGTAFVCGGTLINDRYVLTAAHCLHKEGAKLTHVRLGEHDLSTHEDCDGEACFMPAVDVNVEKIITHDNWNEKTYRHDIGLLRLNSSVSSLGMVTVSPICLPTDVAALNITEDYRYETVGWGLTGWREHSLSNVLQKTTLNGISMSHCNAAICPDRGVAAAYCPILTTQVCVQGVRKRDVCKGDSGGPLTTWNTIRVVQLGITSFKATEICGEDNIPTVFTRVEKYMDWILDHLEP